MSTIENHFKNSLEDVKNTNPNQDIKLKLYGLFKQINEGNNNTSKPWSYQLEKSYNWQAWKDNNNRDKEECMKEYIEIVKKLS